VDFKCMPSWIPCMLRERASGILLYTSIRYRCARKKKILKVLIVI